jgi:hypothetical protein
MTNALWSIISVGDGFEFLPKVGDKILIDQRLKSIGTNRQLKILAITPTQKFGLSNTSG